MKRLRDVFLVAAFAISLALPALWGWIDPGSATLANVAREPLPKQPWRRSFPRHFDLFFESHMGLRRALVRAQHAIDYFVFRVAPSASVLLGDDGWVFLNHDYMPESLAGDPFSPQELERWVTAFKNVEALMAPWGGRVLVVVAPNKATIYPEHLPPGVWQGRRPSRMDALYERLKHQNIAALDLRPSLWATKERAQVYPKRDTHWSGIGVVVATQAIADAVSRLSGKPSLLRREEIILEQRRMTGDLAAMLELGGWADEETLYPSVPKGEAFAQAMAPWQVAAGDPVFAQGALIYAGSQRLAPVVVVHHDSFGLALRPCCLTHSRRARGYTGGTRSTCTLSSGINQMCLST
jgi:hypothetical protein